MSTLFSDNFNRADGAVGSNWSIVSGSWTVNTNQLRLSGAGTPDIIHTTTSAHAAVADCRASVTRTYAGTDFNSGPVVRGSGTSGSYTCYYLDCADSFYGLYRRVANADTELVTYAPTTANLDVIGLQAVTVGATVELSMWLNGVQVGSTYVDNSGSRITASGRCGILNWFNNITSYDDFLVETAASSGPSIPVISQSYYRRRRKP